MILVGLSMFLIPIEIVSRWDLLWSHLHLYGLKDPWEHFSQHSYGFTPVGLSFSIIRFKIWMKVALHWWPLLSKRPPIQWPFRCLFVHVMSFRAIVFQVSLLWRTRNNSLWFFPVFCSLEFLSMNMVLSNQFIGYKLSLTRFWCQVPGIFRNYIPVEMTLIRIQQSPLPGDVHSHILKDHGIHKQGRWRNSWTICRQCWDSAPGM